MLFSLNNVKGGSFSYGHSLISEGRLDVFMLLDDSS